jgi:N-acetyl-alpha-D-muramate 1-phosphate uridylyltransferase
MSLAQAAPLAMIFAAGRGERMRPLTDRKPKPLLEAGGKALIVWQIEALARAGFGRIVINHAWLGEQFAAVLGDGARWGVRLAFSAEAAALETAGGIAQARPLLEADGAPQAFVGVAGDIISDYDYRALLPRLDQARQQIAAGEPPRMHLVMVPNPVYHAHGDFALRDGQLFLDGSPRLTFGSIGVYDTRMFHGLVAGERKALSPYYRETIAAGLGSGELHQGLWYNVGTPDQLQALDLALRESHR